MADLTVTNPLTANGVAPTSNVAAASDRFAVTRGRKYLYRVANGGGSPDNVTFDDPNSQLPVGGSGTAGTFADVVVACTNGQQRAFLVDADRFADANGWVNLTHSFTTSVTQEVYGPL
jgi:hypothetical protein